MVLAFPDGMGEDSLRPGRQLLRSQRPGMVHQLPGIWLLNHHMQRRAGARCMEATGQRRTRSPPLSSDGSVAGRTQRAQTEQFPRSGCGKWQNPAGLRRQDSRGASGCFVGRVGGSNLVSGLTYVQGSLWAGGRILAVAGAWRNGPPDPLPVAFFWQFTIDYFLTLTTDALKVAEFPKPCDLKGAMEQWTMPSLMTVLKDVSFKPSNHGLKGHMSGRMESELQGSNVPFLSHPRPPTCAKIQSGTHSWPRIPSRVS